ncbi:LacI family transcriptional regulator [bacterium]|nr:LacI family transcriptional regulator [bacterium]
MAGQKTKSGKRRVTIMDVAKEAGVSIAAVSRILNNSYEGFSAREETKQRVYAAVKKLNYVASRAAVRLATGKTQAIAFCYPGHGIGDTAIDTSQISTVFGQFDHMLQVHGVARAANSARYDLVLMMRGGERTLEQLLTQAQETVDGIIYVQPEADKKIMKKVVSAEIPVAIVGPAPVEGDNFCSVRVDEFTAGRMAMGHLIVAGSRRVIVAVPEALVHETAIQDRLEGVKIAVKTFSDPALGFDVVQLPYDMDVAKSKLISHIGKWGKPDGVLTLGGVLPFAVMQALESEGLLVPDDVKVVGFDENPMYQLHSPPITGIRYPIEEMCRKAAEILLERIKSGKTPEPVLMTPKMIARKSSEASFLF